MNKDNNNKKEDNVFPATVVEIINKHTVVINRGLLHKVKEGQRFLIYELSEEDIIDPISGESLGRLEIVKGTGKVIHAQERMASVESDKKSFPERKIIRKKSPSFFGFENIEDVETIIPSSGILEFNHPLIGDKAKPI